MRNGRSKISRWGCGRYSGGITPGNLGDAASLSDSTEVVQAVEGKPAFGEHLAKHIHTAIYLTISALSDKAFVSDYDVVKKEDQSVESGFQDSAGSVCSSMSTEQILETARGYKRLGLFDEARAECETIPEDDLY